jgi:hypothetical protein
MVNAMVHASWEAKALFSRPGLRLWSLTVLGKTAQGAARDRETGDFEMGSMYLSYVFLFLAVGLIGLVIGWFTRGVIVAGRRKMIQADIEEYRRMISEVRNRRATVVAGQRAADMV